MTARPTPAQLDYALRLPPGTIVMEPPDRPPRPGDPFRILARIEPAGHGWRVHLRAVGL